METQSQTGHDPKPRLWSPLTAASLTPDRGKAAMGLPKRASAFSVLILPEGSGPLALAPCFRVETPAPSATATPEFLTLGKVPLCALIFETSGCHYAALMVWKALYVDQDGLEVPEVHPPLPPECWNQTLSAPRSPTTDSRISDFNSASKWFEFQTLKLCAFFV